MRSLADEVPFDIPDSWEWVRVRNCTELFNGRAFKPSDWTVMGLPIVRIQNLNDEKAPFNYYDKSVDEDVHLYGGELLFAWSGTPGTSFGAHIWRDQEAVLNQHIFKLLFDENALFKPYYMYALNQRVGSLIKAAHGSAGLQHVTRGVFESTLIPLPPFAEQIRIVEKLNVLFPIVDHYSSAYDNLNNLQSAFPEALKKSILHEAVRGKLVPQNPNEEPASVLLERIRAEKQRLIKEGKIKKDKHESIIFRRDNSHYEKLDGVERCIDEELPFEIPNSWHWVRLSDICEYIQRGKSPKYSQIKKYPVIAQKCNQWSGFSIEKAQFVEPESICTYGQERFLQDNDLMWNSTGLGTLGRMAIYKCELNPYGSAVADSHVTVIRPMKEFVLPQYLYFYFSNPTVQSVIEDQADGTTKQKELSTTTVRSYLVPLPPYNEQIRIVKQTEAVLTLVMQI